MQALYKEQKASNVVHLFPYWNMLSFSFTIIEFSLDKAFEWLCSTPLPLQRGEREGISSAEQGYSYASHILKAVLLQEGKCPFSIPEYAFIL